MRIRTVLQGSSWGQKALHQRGDENLPEILQDTLDKTNEALGRFRELSKHLERRHNDEIAETEELLKQNKVSLGVSLSVLREIGPLFTKREKS